ncbi:MAG: peptide chain release factor N(5)-glutamine methyltransferase [Methylococcaceae bacterium]|jgi:release factor glutamine methyltransferase|nr:peptide chain release factor N(5)-glutamine methyltransferase [Methylococcaceae bacterium]MDP2391996.1 peptide chain release factor N(5)-glutamine methyltransferase [Methylococcaceae bacterium]MDP3020899.1 peptide chain release factor N(5)-glutamine methyltransferase [Methylococcaceae bacterium]MDP3391113.1 peptide chain release factor N(5)-glutamine methyltransferase [Methylococcaceae bacterium]MDP3932912.1 peptide chain release factor N(5)-glutamine methyltransferase [Methylococcaceae bact
MPCIQSLLSEAKDRLATSSDSAVLDAEVLMCNVLGKPRSYLRAWPEKTLNASDLDAYWQLVELRKQGQPIAYITGKKEFWSRDFVVTPDVLIPRPDTEILIEIALTLIPEYQPVNIIDLGTGSGIIAITLAAERPLANIIAIDQSDAALTCAQNNAIKHQINNVRFINSNWFGNIPISRFDLIISNPPYIAEDDIHLQQGDLRFEPQSALHAKDQGLSDIKIIISEARSYLKTDGYLLIEHGYNQEQQMQKLFADANYQQITTYQDYANQPRVTLGRWHG